MNGDPYARTSQSSDRRVINKSGAGAASAYRPADEPQPAKDELPRSVPRSSGSRRSERDGSNKGSNRGLLWTIFIILLIAGIAVAGWFVWSGLKNANAGIDNSKYQAVFLTNGQIYFGKLESYNSDYFRLSTGYSAQPASTSGEQTEQAETSTTNSDVQLIRLGDEVYGPENEIFITKQQVLHFENLKKDSKVTQLIDQNEAARK